MPESADPGRCPEATPLGAAGSAGASPRSPCDEVAPVLQDELERLLERRRVAAALEHRRGSRVASRARPSLRLRRRQPAAPGRRSARARPSARRGRSPGRRRCRRRHECAPRARRAARPSQPDVARSRSRSTSASASMRRSSTRSLAIRRAVPRSSREAISSVCRTVTSGRSPAMLCDGVVAAALGRAGMPASRTRPANTSGTHDAHRPERGPPCFASARGDRREEAVEGARPRARQQRQRPHGADDGQRAEDRHLRRELRRLRRDQQHGQQPDPDRVRAAPAGASRGSSWGR